MSVHDVRRRLAAAMLAVSVVAMSGWTHTTAAQDTDRDTIVSRPLSLGDAARLAAHQSATAVEARFQAAQSAAQVTQARSDLLPTVSAYALEHGVTINTATFGFALPGLDPGGQLLGPVNTIDVRGKLSQTVFDWAALSRVRSAKSTSVASNATASDVAEQAVGTREVGRALDRGHHLNRCDFHVRVSVLGSIASPAASRPGPRAAGGAAPS